MNTTIYGLYDGEQQANQARERLLAAGVKRRAIQILALSSAEREHMGSFAEGADHDHGTERDHVGSFDESAAHSHSPERDRVGSFAGGAGSDHVGSFAAHRHADDILRDLGAAGIASDAAQACLAQMSRGALLVLVKPSADLLAQAAAILRA